VPPIPTSYLEDPLIACAALVHIIVTAFLSPTTRIQVDVMLLVWEQEIGSAVGQDGAQNYIR
jgi:hypothetical protein